MVTRSENCPRKEVNVQNGEGLAKMKELATREALYGHGRLFAHTILEPGCSIGYHRHENETEWYYILKGEAVFNDNGAEVLLHPGDIAATGYGESHGMENRGVEPVEFIALIVMQ